MFVFFPLVEFREVSLFDPQDKEAGYRVEKNESLVKLGQHLSRCYDEKNVWHSQEKKRQDLIWRCEGFKTAVSYYPKQ